MKNIWFRVLTIFLIFILLPTQSGFAEEEKTPSSAPLTEGDLYKFQNDYTALTEQLKRLELAISQNHKLLQEMNEKIQLLKNDAEEYERELDTLKSWIDSQSELIQSSQGKGKINQYLDYVFHSDENSFLERIFKGVGRVKEKQKQIEQYNDKLIQLEKSKSSLEKANEEIERLQVEKEGVLLVLEEQVLEKPNLIEEIDLKKIELQEYETENKVPELYEADESVGDSDRAFSRVKEISMPEGDFTFPTIGTVSSFFGNRDGIWRSGIEIRKNQDGPVPVIAAASGLVMKSYFSIDKGNVIHIQHEINGKKFETIYSHLDTRVVPAGVSVEKGTYIGTMGDTDPSPFFLEMTKEKNGKMELINPLIYLGLSS